MRARRRLGLGLGACAIGLAACGGGGAVEISDAGSASGGSPDVAPEYNASDDGGPEAAAAANLPLLQPAENVVDFEVLDVSDGSISNLSQEVTGDRPVLLWFFSPH